MSDSPRFSLALPDFKSLGKSLALSVAGAAVTAFAGWLSSADFGALNTLVAALSPFLINVLRKWASGPTPAGG